ncbi:MAG: hypothetical protein NDJ89_16535, partial [Oligoflexia bacterium]|nr:hypothetical protein [Oligoflexia bacterium]
TRKGEKGLIQKWFGDPSLSTLKLDRLVRISQRLGASPPPKTLEALSIIRRFKSSQGTPGRSTEQELYPDEAIPFIFMEIIYPAQLGIIENLPHFVAAVKEGRCANPGAKEWTDCALTEFPWRQPLTSIDKVLRIKNLRHGQAAAPLNGRRLSKIMFFDAIASRAVDAFDKFCDNRVAKAAPGDCRIPDHYITLNISSDQNEYDEFLELLSAAGDVADTVGRFYDNIARKLRGLPLLKEDSGTLDPYRNGTWDRRGFARLIAMTSDILVQRPIAERNAAEMLLANLTNIFPANIVFLDQLSVTAIINLIDELPEYREAYLQFADARPDAEGKFINAHSLVVTQEPGTDRTYVDRASVIANLDKMMSVTFPRTYESCRTFLQRCDWRGGNCEISPGSFERSCGIALDEVLSAAIPGTGNISAGDLDLLTILAASMEAVIDSCNVSDGKGRPEELSWSLMDGNDELDCGFIKAKDVVKRLVESKILQVKGVGKPVLNLMLDFTSSTFLTRPMGKVAMIRGTLDGLLLNELTFWAYRKGATVGSLFALVSDIADPARAKELDRWEPQK